MFEELGKESFPEREEQILNFWRDKDIFNESLRHREAGPRFAFYDGPPFATGLPHYGHLLAGTIKDVVPRYKTMKGYYVPRRFGWDCHGLPVENEIEKAHGLTGAKSIEAYGIDKFNEECRSIVLRYTKEWRHTVERMGRWVDFDQTYHTMDLTFMESVWWVFKRLYEQGLVYEGYKVMPYSAKLGTPLSNFEAGENYKEVDDPALTVAFPLEEDAETAVLIWTTTPWTLISNLAVAVGPDIEYALVRDPQSGKKYWVAAERVEVTFPEGAEVLKKVKGRELEGKHYRPPFDYFADQRAKGAFRVLVGDFVSLEEGTGLVHMAPAFGEDDFYLCQQAGIGIVCPVGENGEFTSEVPEYAGQFVKDADKNITRRLKQEGMLVRQANCRHRYPFCWRSDTPLIYKAVTTWFVAVERFREEMVANNLQVHWTPKHIREGRFGKWLEGARDWAISRNRYWGTPIPLWRAEDGEIHVMGSLKELEELTGASITDLHRHYIDDLTFQKGGKTFKRIPEVFDCWFESGSMPYAQLHYPFESETFFEQNFPADFIAEGIDQTRGWFYTLMILSTALFKKPAFKNVIVNGTLLAEDGAKMSKRLKNYPEPDLVVNRHGADAVRLYMLHSQAVKAEDLCFSERGVELVLRQVLIPMWNAYSFFITYARIYGFKPRHKGRLEPKAVIDQWILSTLYRLVEEVEAGLDDYDLSRAVEPFVGFIDQLTNWYIRRSRRRFWQDEATEDRDEAFHTLYQVLLELSKVAAPFTPFLAEAMYRNLRAEGMAESVHLCDFPTPHPDWRDRHLEEAMAAVQAAVSLGHALRKEHKLKVRQPLRCVYLASADPKIYEFFQEQAHLVAEELNVKEVSLSHDEEQFVRFKAKANFRVLGKRVGKLMREVAQAIEAFDQATLTRLSNGHSVTIQVGDETLVLAPEEVEVVREVREGLVASNQGHITIALDTQLDEALLLEGLAREVVNKINTMRREAGFDVTDRITVNLDTTDRVKTCFAHHGQYICHEVLATDVGFEPRKVDGWETTQNWDLNGEEALIALARVRN